MKSYKDLDKDIILNAPFGAMWVLIYDDGQVVYYGCTLGRVHTITPDHHRSIFYPNLANIQESEAIPLPNIEIPWEATEDSKCPVPAGVLTKMFYGSGYSTNKTLNCFLGWNSNYNPITSYKIIDEDYLPTEQEEDIVSYKLPLYTSAHKIEEKSMEQYSLPLPKTKEQLISNLEFLQILHDKFPSIRESVEQYMNSQLDIFICEDWENEE